MPRRSLLPRLRNRIPTLALDHPIWALGILGTLLLVAFVGLAKVREEEDILAFLPQTEPDVVTFRDVAKKFGALRVALIGVEPPSGQNLFSEATLSRLERLSKGLANIGGVDRVVSLSTLTDLDSSAGSVEVRPLLPSPPPADPESLAKLQKRVLSLSHIRGNFVSQDGRAALVMVFLAEGAKTRSVAAQARSLSEKELAGYSLSFGGAPFAGQAIFDDTQVDVKRLTPLALLLFFGVVLYSFRDWLAVILTLGTVAASALVVVGAMGLYGEPFSLVTAMLPVILFAAGSQYAIHILGRYYLLRIKEDAKQSARESLRIAGPPVSIAAACTGIGFLSFVVMNVQPMRSFGVACAIGIFVCWLISVTVLPAVVTRWARPYEKHPTLVSLEDHLERLWNKVQRRRVPVLVGAAALLGLCAFFATDVEVRMEPRAFFRKGSEPQKAQAFLDSRFGGSQFIQIAIEGDVVNPVALRELRHLAAYARSLPGVSQVQSLVDPMVLIGDAMGSGVSLPNTRQQVGNLMLFLESDSSVRSLLTQDRKGSLIHVRVKSDPRPVVQELERYLGKKWPFPMTAHTKDDLVHEVGWVLGTPLSVEQHKAVLGVLAKLEAGEGPVGNGVEARSKALKEIFDETLAGADGEGIRGHLQGLTKDQEHKLLSANAASLADSLASVADELAKAGDKAASRDALEVFLGAVVDRLASKEKTAAVSRVVDDLVAAATTKAGGQAASSVTPDQRHGLALVVQAAATKAEGARTDVAPTLPGFAEATQAGLAATAHAEGTLRARLSGEPLLDRGFTKAVEQNQWASLRVALIAVFVVLLISLRSAFAAAICMIPAGLSLAVSFGALGLFHRPMDIGTSLVGSIVTGSGADFAMHYMWYLRHNHPKEVVRNVGPVILATAVLLGAGLGVLGLGSSPPMQLFGWLSAGGMVLSAIFTFLLVPALVRKARSERRDFG